MKFNDFLAEGHCASYDCMDVLLVELKKATPFAEGISKDQAKDLIAIIQELGRARKKLKEQSKLELVGRVEHRKDTTQYGILNTHVPAGTKLYILGTK